VDAPLTGTQIRLASRPTGSPTAENFELASAPVDVGGEHLEAALSALTVHGRVVACGMISTYNDTDASPAPRNLRLIVGKRLTIRGMLVHDHADQRPRFLRDIDRWLAAGDIQYRETVVHGLANAPDALIGLLRGDNLGKMLVTI
jgi:NADPH-dependent curcumin reductase CurA